MSNSGLFRFGGWCALLAALVSLTAVVALTAMPDNLTAAAILTVAGVLILTPVFYGLYVAHRAESGGLSLAGLVLWVVALVPNLASAFDPRNHPLYAVSSLAFVPPLLVFGLLAYRSARWPRGLAAMVVLAGILLGISGAVSFNGNSDIGTAAAAGGAAFLLVWLVWLWRMFWSEGLALA